MSNKLQLDLWPTALNDVFHVRLFPFFGLKDGKMGSCKKKQKKNAALALVQHHLFSVEQGGLARRPTYHTSLLFLKEEGQCGL